MNYWLIKNNWQKFKNFANIKRSKTFEEKILSYIFCWPAKQCWGKRNDLLNTKIPFLYHLKTFKNLQFSNKFWNRLKEIFKDFEILKQVFFTAAPIFTCFYVKKRSITNLFSRSPIEPASSLLGHVLLFELL